MTKLLIHIGMEKTGSTSIQKALIDCRKKLAQQSIKYPRFIRRENHNYLASAYIDPKSARISRKLSKYDLEKRKNIVNKFRQNILNQVSKSENTIISGEHFFRLEPEEISEFRDNLLDTGVSDIRVIGYIRDPVSFYLSFAQQELKGSSRFPAPRSFYIPYSDRIQAWNEHFDCEFFDFSEARTGDGGLVGHFSSRVERFFGIQVEIATNTSSFHNESLSAEEMQIVQDFRRHIYKKNDGIFNKETYYLLGAFLLFRDQRWKKPILSDEVVGLITARHSEGLEYLVQEYGFNFRNSPPVSSANTLALEDCSVKDIVSNFDTGLYHELYSRLLLTLVQQPFFNLSRSIRTRMSRRRRK